MTIPRYSAALPDDRGFLSFTGDLYDPSQSIVQLQKAIQGHLDTEIADVHAKVAVGLMGTRRRVNVAITRAKADLSDRSERQSVLDEVRDQVFRFGYDRSNYQTDLHQSAFIVTLTVDPTYWAHRQRTTGKNLIENKMTVAAFRKAISPGDELEVIAGENIGRKHRVLSVAKRFVTDDGLTGSGQFHWDFPQAAAFACDGTNIRIAKGTTEKPDEHLLLKWTRKGSE